MEWSCPRLGGGARFLSCNGEVDDGRVAREREPAAGSVRDGDLREGRSIVPLSGRVLV